MDQEIAKEIGIRVKAARKEKGLTQEVLASGAGIDVSYLSRIENGKLNVSVLTLWKIKLVLGISINELVSDQLDS